MAEEKDDIVIEDDEEEEASDGEPEKEEVAVVSRTRNDVDGADTDGDSTSGPAAVAYDGPVMTTVLFIYWILPITIIAIFSRFTVNTRIGEIKLEGGPGQSVPFLLDQSYIDQTDSIVAETEQRIPGNSIHKTPSTFPSSQTDWQVPKSWPPSYSDIIRTIESRRKHWRDHPKYDLKDSPPPTTTTAKSSHRTTPESKASPHRNDPQRQQLVQMINQMREASHTDRENMFHAIKLADLMRYYDTTYHEGGTFEKEAIQTYLHAAQLAEKKREENLSKGELTNQCKMESIHSVNEEITINYEMKSIDGVLCGIYTSLGKVYFLANMFESSVDALNRCLSIEPSYTDALNSRGSSFIVLGKYEEAGSDFMKVLQYDRHRLFPDAFTGLARVLEADETAVAGGWETISTMLNKIIPMFEEKLVHHSEQKMRLAPALSRFYHALFTYHDKKTKNPDAAFENLLKAYHHKMSVLPAWVKGSELERSSTTQKIFHRGFWSDNTGSRTTTPIFIVGFVRSGSTLLERVLDAHPLIVGTGENSVFNGRLPDIRDQIVKLSSSGRMDELPQLTRDLAESVVEDMKLRWEALEAASPGEEGTTIDPQRFVDKMLTNYYNIGFIHLLYPNALVLHVYRNPMDTVFSAFKHDFPNGPLDYSCEFEGLSEMYHAYRSIMEHWDTVLPGRVVHIRHEDMVNDFEGMARAIISKTGLPWDDSVLEFHKKKHAVNTFSSTQVRKGVYKGGMGAWQRYETHLHSLKELLGDRVEFDVPHSLQPLLVPSTKNDEL